MVEFSGRSIGPGFPCLVIAELGTSHQGDLGRARALIDAAVGAGADCIKFQLVHAEEILHPLSGFVPLPTGNVALYEQFRALERGLDFYAALKEYTEAAGALFLCSPFGIRSARELRELGCGALKIASPELNHFPLLGEVAGYGCRCSCQPASRSSATSSVPSQSREPSGSFSCTASHPIQRRRKSTTWPSLRASAAYSGCRPASPITPWIRSSCLRFPRSAAPAAVEKHFTLSRSDTGLDDPIALEPADFRRMVDAIRQAESEEPGEVLGRLRRDYGARSCGCRHRIRSEGPGPRGARKLRPDQALAARGQRKSAKAWSSASRSLGAAHGKSAPTGDRPRVPFPGGRGDGKEKRPRRRGHRMGRPALSFTGLAPIRNIG